MCIRDRVYEGGIEYEEHGDASTVGYYCVDASVLEDQIICGRQLGNL